MTDDRRRRDDETKFILDLTKCVLDLTGVGDFSSCVFDVCSVSSFTSSFDRIQFRRKTYTYKKKLFRSVSERKTNLRETVNFAGHELTLSLQSTVSRFLSKSLKINLTWYGFTGQSKFYYFYRFLNWSIVISSWKEVITVTAHEDLHVTKYNWGFSHKITIPRRQKNNAVQFVFPRLPMRFCVPLHVTRA